MASQLSTKQHASRWENELERTPAELARKLREGFKSGSAKLAYLLGIDPHAELVLVERQFAAFNLVDPQTPVTELVAQALSAGPGVKEMEGILNLINEANERNRGLAKYLPVFDVRVDASEPTSCVLETDVAPSVPALVDPSVSENGAARPGNSER